VTDPSSSQYRRAVGAWVLVCIFWSTTFLAIRIGVQTLPPLAVVSGARYIAAGLLLFAIVRMRGVPLPSRESWPGHALLGAIMLGLGNGALVWAEQFVPSGMSAVMVATIPFWMIGIEAILPSGERIRAAQLAGLVLGFVGLVLLAMWSSPPAGETSRQFLHGAIAVQVSCCGWAIGSAYSRRHARHEDSFAAAAMQMLFGGVMLLVVGSALGEWSHPAHVSIEGIFAWLYLIFFGAIVGYASYIYALKYLPVTFVSLYAYITPLLAVILGAIVMREPVTGRMGIAIAIIFAGMVVVRRHADTSRS